ncbi:MAG: hypothetical protein K0S61_730 [Anaerocolumna sp.]|jgi:hypothetical protein|nr:hypothetical protein [Anaerocolumna sp.]
MWERLYAALKLTRENDNIPLTIESNIQKINELITVKEIENMKAEDIKEAVINYLEVIVPGMRK